MANLKKDIVWPQDQAAEACALRDETFQRMVKLMGDHDSDLIARHRKRTGRSSHAIRVGRPTETWIYRNGRRVKVRR